MRPVSPSCSKTPSSLSRDTLLPFCNRYIIQMPDLEVHLFKMHRVAFFGKIRACAIVIEIETKSRDDRILNNRVPQRELSC